MHLQTLESIGGDWQILGRTWGVGQWFLGVGGRSIADIVNEAEQRMTNHAETLGAWESSALGTR